MVTHPSNARDAVIFDDEQSAAYLTKYESDWQKFQLKKSATAAGIRSCGCRPP